MIECRNDDMRDLLPLLAHGALDAHASARVRTHVAGCEACRAELALVERAGAAIDASVPALDLAAITAGVRRATRLRLERPARARWMPRRVAAVAASLLLVATASIGVFATRDGRPGASLVDSAGVAGSVPDRRIVASAGVPVPGGLSELSDDDLVTLLAELDRVEATVEAEPLSMRQAVVDVPENF